MNDLRETTLRHNFDAVNTHVQGFTRHVNALVAEKRAHNFATYAKWTAIAALACGGAAFVAMAGYSLLKEPRIKTVTETKVVEKPVAYQPTIIVESDSRERITQQEAGRRIDEIASDTGEQPSIFNYVIFRRVPFSADGFDTIHVGMRYTNAQDRVPSGQWCYVERYQRETGTRRTVQLATKDGDRRHDTVLGEKHARELGTTRAILLQAQSQCVFR